MKQYLIIGGSSGIGAATARLLGAYARVYATYFSHMQEAAGNVTYHHSDVTADTPDFSFLPERLDGLVYCPGRILLKPFARIKPEEFTGDFVLQVGGFIKTLQAALPALKASGAASVIAISTVAVQRGFPYHSIVSASKARWKACCAL